MRPFVARLGCEKLVVVEVYEADELAESQLSSHALSALCVRVSGAV